MVLVASLENIGQIIEVLMRGDNNDTVIELDAIITVGDDDLIFSDDASDQTVILDLQILERLVINVLLLFCKELQGLYLIVY